MQGGALQIKKNYKNVVFIFLLPPTMDELKIELLKEVLNQRKILIGDIKTPLRN